MSVPTETIGGIPRPQRLLHGIRDNAAARLDDSAPAERYDAAARDTIARHETVGSAVVTDGQQAKPGDMTHPLGGLTNLAPDGAVIPFADGHTRRGPSPQSGPFRYSTTTAPYPRAALEYATVPVEQPVVSTSALCPMYPATEFDRYPREQFLADNVEADIRGALDGGADSVRPAAAAAELGL